MAFEFLLYGNQTGTALATCFARAKEKGITYVIHDIIFFYEGLSFFQPSAAHPNVALQLAGLFHYIRCLVQPRTIDGFNSRYF